MIFFLHKKSQFWFFLRKMKKGDLRPRKGEASRASREQVSVISDVASRGRRRHTACKRTPNLAAGLFQGNTTLGRLLCPQVLIKGPI